MSQPPVAPRARLGLDKMETQVVKVPQIRIITIDGVQGVWVPLHPMAEVKRAVPR